MKTIVLTLLLGACTSVEKSVWDPTVPWNETPEAKELAEHQGTPRLPDPTPYDDRENERGLYQHGYLHGWHAWQIHGAASVGASWFPPRYAMNHSRLQKIWNEGLAEGQKSAIDENPHIPSLFNHIRHQTLRVRCLDPWRNPRIFLEETL
ncbi:MAG: hypothetical protein LAT83_23515 [Kiritimatiellae bacterium]|nr:hypothetical protein [Kiritimatiellia bacterium]